MKKFIFCCLLFLSLIVGGIGKGDPARDERSAALDLQAGLNNTAHNPSKEEWDALEARLESYQTDYGTTPQTTHNLIALRSIQLKIAKAFNGEEAYDALILKIAADPNPAVAALTARLAALKTKPIDLQFTAVDGTPVDLAKLRGKVVLVDFWATWCGPCVEEVPDVVAAYQKYHSQGFEIVGISLDQDKNSLVAFTQQNGMTWPQYFDGKGWNNDISSSYGIKAIPAMLLIGKDGLIASYKARENLADKVAKALGEPVSSTSTP